jgi:hypothetical protein
MIEERLSMYDDLMEKDPKMRKIRAESEARGEEGCDRDAAYDDPLIGERAVSYLA